MLRAQAASLADGTFFGEIALLHRTKRSGTVTATRKTRLLALDAQDFHALIERMPALAAHVHKTAKARIADAAEAAKGDLAAAEIAQGRARRPAAEGKIGRASGVAYCAGVDVEEGGWSSPAASRRRPAWVSPSTPSRLKA
jgi:CRP-like cAMP-binding protein